MVHVIVVNRVSRAVKLLRRSGNLEVFGSLDVVWSSISGAAKGNFRLNFLQSHLAY